MLDHKWPRGFFCFILALVLTAITVAIAVCAYKARFEHVMASDWPEWFKFMLI